MPVRLSIRILAGLLVLLSSGVALAQDAASNQIQDDSALQILDLQQQLEKDPYDGEAHTKLGILYVQEELYDEARTEFIAAIQIAPAEPLTHFNLGVCLIKMERFDEAVGTLQAFNSLAPDDGRGYILLGDALLETDRADEARATWEKGIAMPNVAPPDKVEMLRRLVDSYEDDREQAIAVLEQYAPLVRRREAPDLREKRDYLYLSLAKDAADAGSNEAALEWYGKALASDDPKAQAYQGTAEIYIEQGRLDEADKLLVDGETKAHSNAVIPFMQGRVAEERGDLDSAAKYYKAANARDPNLPGLSASLGGVLAQLGDTGGASVALQNANQRGEGGAAAKYNLAVMKTKEGQYSAAIPLLVEVIDEEPERKDAYRALGTSYRKTEQYAKAADTYQELIDTFGPDSKDLYQLAYTQSKSNQYSKAVQNYEMVAALEPDNFNAFYGLGRAYSELARYEESIEAFTQAAELQPDNEIAIFNLAFTLQKAARYEEAIDTYLEAADIKETSRSYTNIAICYSKLGDTDAADEYYEKANDLKKKGK